VWISAQQRSFSDEADLPKVQWHPRVLCVGIGCERGSNHELIEHAVEETFKAHHLARGAIATLNTLDLKSDEPGLIAFCDAHNLPLHCFTPAQLKDIPVPNPSDVVNQAVGTPSVAEAAAIFGAMDKTRQSENLPELRVQKQVYRHPDYNGAVTVAIAQSTTEYTDRIGHLALIGTGPGSLDQITPAAKAAIAHADVGSATGSTWT